MNFSDIYVEYYSKLKRFAFGFVNDEPDAENLVHDVFLDLWNRQEEFDRINNINAYMFRLVRNRCLDHIKHRNTEQQYALGVNFLADYYVSALDSFNVTDIFMSDLEKDVEFAISSLPKRCREVFSMSRFEGKKYREIADALGISENTVEIQMGIALKKLKEKLAKYVN